MIPLIACTLVLALAAGVLLLPVPGSHVHLVGAGYFIRSPSGVSAPGHLSLAVSDLDHESATRFWTEFMQALNQPRLGREYAIHEFSKQPRRGRSDG